MHRCGRYEFDVSNTRLKGTFYEKFADKVEYFVREALSFGVCFPADCSNQDNELAIQNGKYTESKYITTTTCFICVAALVDSGLVVTLHPHYEFDGMEVEPVPMDTSIST